MGTRQRKVWPLARQYDATSPPSRVGENRRECFGRGEMHPPGDKHRRRFGGLADTKITKVPEVARDAGLVCWAGLFQSDPFTQIVQPRIEANFYGKSDVARDIGKGLSDVTTGIRVRYEFTRQFAPYVGVEWANRFGQTADLARAAGEQIRNTRYVAGVRFWF